jgi:hypothetical protein
MVSKQGKKKRRKKKRHEMVFNVWLNKPIVTHDNRHYKKKYKIKTALEEYARRLQNREVRLAAYRYRIVKI